MSKINLFDLFISLIIAVAIFLLIIAIALTINDYTVSYYEYEMIDGEKGTATYCIDPYREIPYCMLDDGTKLYGIKQYKKVQRSKNEKI